MNGKALWGGLKSYLGAILAIVLFPLLWVRLVRFARRHKADDRRGVAKVGVAIVASLLIAAGLGLQFEKFQHGATNGMYASMDKRLSAAVGESEYEDNVAAVGSADLAIPIIQRNLANATAANDTGKMADLSKALNDTQKARDTAAGKVTLLAPDHQLFVSFQPDVQAHADAAIRQKIESARAGLGGAYPTSVTASSTAAFAIKDRSVHDMRNAMLAFLWPSLVGAALAPLVFAAGSILNASYVESDTVGFKKYPAGAAGFFLLFGAFGVPSIPFAAWVFVDIEARSREGQIAL